MKSAASIAILLFALRLFAANPNDVTWIDPAKAAAEDPDFSIQGEYGSTAPGLPWGLQVIAMGNGQFEAYALEGGLPGAGWDKSHKRLKLSGKTTDAVTALTGTDGLSAEISKGQAQLTVNGTAVALPRIIRESATAGAAPPAGAVVLFNGSTADAWDNGSLDGDLLVSSNASSKRLFSSYTLHIEFRTPYKPFARGQGRGNSGIYHQSRYETQVLDSFGLEGKMNETGGIYSIAAPRINMCLPPLSWQTYDVDFTAAQYENGSKVKNPVITVRLNGILIHENQELPHSTTSSPLKDGPEPGPLFLQNHGNPVRFRNIWMVEKP